MMYIYIYIYTRVDPPIYIGGNVNSSEVEQQFSDASGYLITCDVKLSKSPVTLTWALLIISKVEQDLSNVDRVVDLLTLARPVSL